MKKETIKKTVVFVSMIMMAICFSSCIETCEGECEIVNDELICPC